MDDARIFFETELRPRRSLSPLGFQIVMTLVVLISFAAGLVFTMIGAWPVFGFFGLDVLLIYWAFRANYRSARLIEHVKLDDEALTVARFDPNGDVRSWRFEPYWVQVTAESGTWRRGRLILRSHGRGVEIGGFLTEDQRLGLAAALKDALYRQRQAVAQSLSPNTSTIS